MEPDNEYGRVAFLGLDVMGTRWPATYADTTSSPPIVSLGKLRDGFAEYGGAAFAVPLSPSWAAAASAVAAPPAPLAARHSKKIRQREIAASPSQALLRFRRAWAMFDADLRCRSTPIRSAHIGLAHALATSSFN
jgi:hypothetical protein